MLPATGKSQTDMTARGKILLSRTERAFISSQQIIQAEKANSIQPPPPPGRKSTFRPATMPSSHNLSSQLLLSPPRRNRLMGSRLDTRSFSLASGFSQIVSVVHTKGVSALSFIHKCRAFSWTGWSSCLHFILYSYESLSNYQYLTVVLQ